MWHLSAQPPVDLHWFFEISIRTKKKFQLELKKKIQLVYTEILMSAAVAMLVKAR